jgi:membrane-associated phospholipid phosphatase
MEESRKKRSELSFLEKFSLKFLLVAGLFVITLWLFALIAYGVFFQNEYEFDNKLIHFFSPYSTQPFIRLVRFFSFFGSGKFLLPAYVLMIIYFLIRRKRVLCLHIAIIALTSTALSQGAKRIFQRARPDLPLMQALKTYSFPSGHALSSFIFCSVLVYLIWRARIQIFWKWLFSIFLFLFSMTIGMSRVVLKMHYPTDVLAGFCLGFIWVILSFYLLNRIQSQRSKSRDLQPNGN